MQQSEAPKEKYQCEFQTGFRQTCHILMLHLLGRFTSQGILCAILTFRVCRQTCCRFALLGDCACNWFSIRVRLNDFQDLFAVRLLCCFAVTLLCCETPVTSKDPQHRSSTLTFPLASPIPTATTTAELQVQLPVVPHKAVAEVSE